MTKMLSQWAGAVVLACALLATHANCMAEIITREIEYTVGDVQMKGYLAYDDAVTAPRPGVLVVHEWWGLNDYPKMRARQLAEAGFVAFAGDMYGQGKSTDDAKEAGQWAGQVRGDKELMRRRARAALDVLANRPEVDKSRLAAIGYCFGGSVVTELAYSGAPLRAVVSFHGSLPALQEADAPNVKAGILALHGADDGNVPDKQVQTFMNGLRKTDIDWHLVVYADAKHAFTNPAADKHASKNVGYNATADRRSWKHMMMFFDEALAK